MNPNVDAGLEKSAIVVLALGEEGAAQVLKFFDPREVEKLGVQMMKTSANITKDKQGQVFKEFLDIANAKSALGVNSSSYVRNVLVKALGDEKASFLLDRIMQSSDNSGIEGLKWVDPDAIGEFIKEEHPQIIATILVHLERDQAASVLNKLNERLRSDVIYRISTLDGVQPIALKQLNEVLSNLIAGGDKLKKTSLGGARAAAEILNFVGVSSEKNILDNIREIDADLSMRIEEEMFTFENFMDLDDSAIQLVLRETPGETLVVALKGTDEVIRGKFFQNMTSRAADGLRDDIDNRGPMRISEVESAQKDLLKIVRRLADEGQISLGTGVEDAFVQ